MICEGESQLAAALQHLIELHSVTYACSVAQPIYLAFLSAPRTVLSNYLIDVGRTADFEKAQRQSMVA